MAWIDMAVNNQNGIWTGKCQGISVGDAICLEFDGFHNPPAVSITKTDKLRFLGSSCPYTGIRGGGNIFWLRFNVYPLDLAAMIKRAKSSGKFSCDSAYENVFEWWDGVQPVSETTLAEWLIA